MIVVMLTAKLVDECYIISVKQEIYIRGNKGKLLNFQNLFFSVIQFFCNKKEALVSVTNFLLSHDLNHSVVNSLQIAISTLCDTCLIFPLTYKRLPFESNEL